MRLEIPDNVLEDWKKALHKRREEAIEGGNKVIDRAGRTIEANVARRVAAESTDVGQYEQSIFYRRDKDLSGDVGATAAHAPYVEWGTDAHFPPFDPIREWVWRKRHDFGIRDSEVDSVAWAVCLKIARVGTKPRMQWHEEIKKVQPHFINWLKEEIARLWKM